MEKSSIRKFKRPSGGYPDTRSLRSFPVPTKKEAGNLRKPVVAGLYYPEKKEQLLDLLDYLIPRTNRRKKCIAISVPHGRHLSSGRVAGEVYSHVEFPSCAVILSSSHTALGNPWGVMTHGTWLTPLGSLGIHTELAKLILHAQPDLFEADAHTHRYDHAIEVQLPFLQRSGSIRWFVPVNIGNRTFEELRNAGLGVAQAIRKLGAEVLLINTTQMTCYEPQEEAVKKDAQLLEPLVALDEKRFFDTTHKLSTSMCGVAPTVVTLCAAKSLGASTATLVKYETSGDVSGDTVSVVGYAGITIQ